MGWGRGRLAWVLGQRDADPGAVSPAVGLCPQHTLSAGDSALAGVNSFPLACRFASQETAQAEVLLLLLPPAGAVCGRWQGVGRARRKRGERKEQCRGS